MKPTHHYLNTGKRFVKMQITFNVDSEIIEYVIADELDFNPNFKPTKTWVEQKIRDLLFNDGCNHWQYRGQEWTSQLKFRAKQKAKRLFPEFYQTILN